MTLVVAVVRPVSRGDSERCLLPIWGEGPHRWSRAFVSSRGSSSGIWFPDPPVWGYYLSPLALAGRPVIYLHDNQDRVPSTIDSETPLIYFWPDKVPHWDGPRF